MKKFTSLVLCLALLLPTSRALAGDFIDTRLSVVLADDDVLANSGESTPNSPTAGLGADAQNNLFFDNFNTKFSGFETLTNLTLYKSAVSFFEGFSAEAALSLLLLETRNGEIDKMKDNSSYIRLNYRPLSWGEKEGFSLTGFPVSGDRFRLGYAYKISWGGNSVFTAAAQKNGVPALKLQLTRDRWYIFIGGKTTLIQDTINTVKEDVRLYGALAGGGVDISSWLHVDLGGGYFTRGMNPNLAEQGIRAPVNAAGLSAQVVAHYREPLQTSIDLSLYKNDPEIFTRLFRPDQYPGGFSFIASLEGSWLTHIVENPDISAKTQLQHAAAVALQARAKYNYWRFHFLGLYRTLSFMQFDVPGVPAYTDFSKGTKLTPELFGAIGFDYNIARAHLTLGIMGGVQLPASFRSPQTVSGGTNPPPSLLGGRTVVVREANQFELLKTGDNAEPIVSAKGTARFDFSEYFSAIGELYYTRDTNRATFARGEAGISEPTYRNPHHLGFNLILQARY